VPADLADRHCSGGTKLTIPYGADDPAEGAIALSRGPGESVAFRPRCILRNTMETPVVSRLLLAIPAAGILALLLEYIRRNRGMNTAVAYAVACGGYGIVRGVWVASISESNNAPMPYRMAGSVRIGAASPMEIVGWMLAAALAWLAGAAIVRLFGSRPGNEPPYRIAFTGALILATLSLAVETAAIAAGWWSWSIAPPPDVVMRVPTIALVDWAFVAFDFLLPFLLLTRPARTLDRALALSLFPLHFASHRYLMAPFPSVPLSLFDVAHFGIPLWVFWRAVDESPSTARSKPEWGAFVPGLAALLVAADTSLTVYLAHEPRVMIFILPLTVVGLLALILGQRKDASPAPATPSARVAWLLRAAAVAVVLANLLFVQLPAIRRRDGYAKNVVEGVAKLNAGDTVGAQVLLQEAVTLRPDKAEPHLLLALSLVRLGRRDDAARELKEAVRIKPALAEYNESREVRDTLAQPNGQVP